MTRKAWAIELIAQIVKDAPTSAASKTAEVIVDRLLEEGVLHLGYGDKEVDRVVDKFVETFGTTKTSRQDRWAANRLVTKYGERAVVGIIDMLASNSTEKFAPVVNNITQLESKMPSVLNFLRNIQQDEVIQL